MNQILSLELDRDKSKKGQADIKKVIIFFVVVVIIFGIILITKSVYSIIKGEPEEKIITSNNLKPEVKVEQDEEKLNINISHTIELSKAQYKWNDETEEEIDLEGETDYEESIDIPLGNNTFYIKVIDSQGHFTEFKSDYATSTDRPQISIEASGEKIKITAKDNKELSYVTYSWDDGEEEKVEATSESSAQIEFEIDILRGKHVLKVTAVNVDNISTTEEQETAAGTEPKIELEQDSNDKKYLKIYVEDVDGVARLDYTLNGEEYTTNDISSMNLKKLTYKQELQEGNNVIKVKATNINGISIEKEAICQYSRGD